MYLKQVMLKFIHTKVPISKNLFVTVDFKMKLADRKLILIIPAKVHTHFSRNKKTKQQNKNALIHSLSCSFPFLQSHIVKSKTLIQPFHGDQIQNPCFFLCRRGHRMHFQTNSTGKLQFPLFIMNCYLFAC